MQCGRVGSRPLSTTEGSHGQVPREPSLHLEATPAQRPTQETHPPAPPSEGRGVECQGRRKARRPRACTFSWSCMLPTTVGSSFASDSGAVPRVRLQGHALRPIVGVVPCAGPKVMLGRFSMPRLQPHVGRTPNYERDRNGTRHCLYSWFSAISLFLP